MVELGKQKRDIIVPLCEKSTEVLVRGAMEGNMGRVWVPKLENPSLCLIHLGDFAYLLGIPPKGVKALDLKSVLYDECAHDFITPENDEWAAWLEENLDGNYRLSSRYALKKDEHHFDDKKLKKFISDIPEEIKIKKIDERIYNKALKEEWCRDFCINFENAADFINNGMGYVAMSGRDIVAGCSAYGFSTGMVEIEVVTRKDHRRKGLALACSAAFLLECITNNIFPNWDAGNLMSVGLAEKLGYVFDKEYKVFQIIDAD